MGRPLAREGDRAIATDLHLSTATPPVTTPMPFVGTLRIGTASGVLVQGRPAVVVGSVAVNDLPHPCSDPASNTGTVVEGSAGVRIQGRPAARAGDRVATCQVSGPAPAGVITSSTPVGVA